MSMMAMEFSYLAINRGVGSARTSGRRRPTAAVVGRWTLSLDVFSTAERRHINRVVRRGLYSCTRQSNNNRCETSDEYKFHLRAALILLNYNIREESLAQHCVNNARGQHGQQLTTISLTMCILLAALTSTQPSSSGASVRMSSA